MTKQERRVIDVDPDMTELQFIRVLKEAGSPALSSAHAVYTYCVQRRVSPAFLLAMFLHESGYGLHGWARKTFSYGNTRPPSFGAMPTVVFDQDSGDWYYWEGARPSGRRYLCAYRDWIDGGVSTVARFVEHAPYAGKTTVEDIIPVWAPGSDGNDTARYIAAVLASMDQWTKEEPVSSQLADAVWLVDITGQANSPDRAMPGGGYNSITIHETDNENPGATARMHRQFVQNGGGAGQASFQAAVDSTESLQIMDWNQAAYHTGRGDDDEAARSVGIEICVNDKLDFDEACRRAALLTAKLLLARNLPLVDGQTVRQHGSWWSPQYPGVHRGCPKHLKAGDWGVTWPQFLALVRDAMAPEQPQHPPKTDGTEIQCYINTFGETMLEINFGGVAVSVDGYVIIEAGVSVVGQDGAMYDRTVRDNTFLPWVKRS